MLWKAGERERLTQAGREKVMTAPRTKRLTLRGRKVLAAVGTGAAYASLFAMMGSSMMLAQTAEQRAWEMLRSGVRQKNTGKRAQAIRALRLLPAESRATEMAEAALGDRKPEVRAVAAKVLGLMGSKEAIPALKSVLSDKKPVVVVAAAHSLQTLNDPAGYQVYYELLTGKRKGSEGVFAEQIEALGDKKKVADLAVGEGIGFIPFAHMGYSTVKTITERNASPVRASAARALIKDSDPRVDQALVQALSDKNWSVRASALLAIAKRDDPDLLTAIVPALTDKNQTVRFTAAAAVIRLSEVAERSRNAENSNTIRSESAGSGCVKDQNQAINKN
jgi:HEAT repeat protein